MIAHTGGLVDARRALIGDDELARGLPQAPPVRSFAQALAAPGMGLIAEMKRASPSKGPIHPGAAVAPVVTAYARAGRRGDLRADRAEVVRREPR